MKNNIEFSLLFLVIASTCHWSNFPYESPTTSKDTLPIELLMISLKSHWNHSMTFVLGSFELDEQLHLDILHAFAL